MKTKPSIPEAPVFKYANFMLRMAAFIVDSMILGFLFKLLSWLLFVTLLINLRMEDFFSDDHEMIMTPFLTTPFITFSLVQLVGFWLYYALTETLFGASPGKLLLHLRVTGLDGRRIGFKKATGHTFARILSFVPFLTGYLMAVFTEKTQALHDLFAGCIVIPARQVIRTKIKPVVEDEEQV
jgi:uncharacterized RDD family membrane protein YckC